MRKKWEQTANIAVQSPLGYRDRIVETTEYYEVTSLASSKPEWEAGMRAYRLASTGEACNVDGDGFLAIQQRTRFQRV